MSTSATTEAPERVADLLHGLRLAMLTTVDATAQVSARPLAVQEIRPDGTIAFIVDQDASWLALAEDATVGLTLTADKRWVSVGGSAQVDRSDEAVEAAAGVAAEGWLGGKAAERGALLLVTPDHVDLWEGPGLVGQAFAVVKGLLSGRTPDIGGHRSIDLA